MCATLLSGGTRIMGFTPRGWLKAPAKFGIGRLGRVTFSGIARQAIRASIAQQRAREREAARSHRAAQRSAALADRQARMDAKEAAKAYLASRVEETEELNREIAERERSITYLLFMAISDDPRLPVDSLRKRYAPTAFNGETAGFEPEWREFEPPPTGFFASLLPGASSRRDRREAEARAQFETAKTQHRRRLEKRDLAIAAHEAAELKKKRAVEAHNEGIDAIEAGLGNNDHKAIVEFYGLLLSTSLTSEFDAVAADVGYSPDSRHLVVDLELPPLEVVPENTGYRYVKSGDRIDPQARTAAKRGALYASLVNQVVLKCVDTVFRGGPDILDCLSVNGMLETIDPATGQQIRPCLVSVKLTSNDYRGLNLKNVQPDQCLRLLRASVSRSPAELVAVKPLVEIDMVDPRFIDTRDVLSGLDQRVNLMELSPGEFEHLITNLFAKMGLETRTTRASRDGGVDCVAFDLRPILGGKVVIQAKRYKNTVGVSAVRDLYGTLQNEGANRGILVTTSGYGKASHEFANGKPIELVDGGRLLYLLKEHAGLDAKIVAPSGWVDRSNLDEEGE
jgi:restriction system protein